MYQKKIKIKKIKNAKAAEWNRGRGFVIDVGLNQLVRSVPPKQNKTKQKSSHTDHTTFQRAESQMKDASAIPRYPWNTKANSTHPLHAK